MAGGTEHQLVELVTRLDTASFAPAVLCLYGECAGRSLHFLPHFREHGIPVTVLDLEQTVRGKFRGMRELVRYIRHHKPDIVQAVNYHSNLLIRLVRPLLPRSIRFIGCVYVEYTSKQLLYERLSGWLFDAFVCNSPYLERQLQPVLVRRSVEVIFNGIDIDRYAGSQERSFRLCLSPDARRVVLFVGRISCQKSPHLLAEALAILKRESALPVDVVTWIVGETDEVSEQMLLEAVIGQEALQDSIVRLPAVDHPERLYAAADVVVLPSRWEGLPNVMLEALAAGRPVIVSDAANRDGLIRHGVNGWVFPTGDSVRLAEILRLVLNLADEELSAMRLACQETVVGFDVENMVCCYERLYVRLSSRS